MAIGKRLSNFSRNDGYTFPFIKTPALSTITVIISAILFICSTDGVSGQIPPDEIVDLCIQILDFADVDNDNRIYNTEYNIAVSILTENAISVDEAAKSLPLLAAFNSNACILASEEFDCGVTCCEGKTQYVDLSNPEKKENYLFDECTDAYRALCAYYGECPFQPTAYPTYKPSAAPTLTPSASPSLEPSVNPSTALSSAPSITRASNVTYVENRIIIAGNKKGFPTEFVLATTVLSVLILLCTYLFRRKKDDQDNEGDGDVIC